MRLEDGYSQGVLREKGCSYRLSGKPLRINDLNFHVHKAAFAKRGLALGYCYEK